MMGATVFILEDDLRLRTVLVDTLREEGFDVRGVGSGTRLMELIDRALPDAFVIDIGLPDADGRDVCLALRARGIQSPILFLTARSALEDRLSGFRAGGDDYLPKPFALEELVARIGALLRRGGRASPAVGGVQVDEAAHALAVGARSVPLTPTELRIITRLTAGGVVDRDDLMAAAWPGGTFVNPNTLDAYIARLRRKLADLGGQAVIRTVHGSGYILE
jgi:two-component system OmpR family response regulator